MKPGFRVTALLVIGLVAACAVDRLPTAQLTGLNWLSVNTDPISALTTQPATCLRPDSQAAAGELLFNSPLLLGGQAAKAGLSCASCHQNGRGNPHFSFNGISGQPGTADVTNGLFSRVRADETFNPVPIPDLATPEGRSRVDRNTSGILENFLEAQITEEFEGAAPTEVMTAALASYIRALDDRACAPDTREPLTWQREMALISVGLKRINQTPLGDAKTRRAYVNAVRSGLGRLHARYASAPDIQITLEDLSGLVQKSASMTEIERAMDGLKPRLAEHAGMSLYSPETLASALASDAS